MDIPFLQHCQTLNGQFKFSYFKTTVSEDGEHQATKYFDLEYSKLKM